MFGETQKLATHGTLNSTLFFYSVAAPRRHYFSGDGRPSMAPMPSQAVGAVINVSSFTPQGWWPQSRTPWGGLFYFRPWPRWPLKNASSLTSRHISPFFRDNGDTRERVGMWSFQLWQCRQRSLHLGPPTRRPLVGSPAGIMEGSRQLRLPNLNNCADNILADHRLQGAATGWPTGNGKKLSNSQACCLAQLCLAAALLSFFAFPVAEHGSLKPFSVAVQSALGRSPLNGFRPKNGGTLVVGKSEFSPDFPTTNYIFVGNSGNVAELRCLFGSSTV